MKYWHLIFIAINLLNFEVFAKGVKIKWTPIRGAVHYELQIKQGDKLIKREELNAGKTQWNSQLSAGIYQYQVRGIDRMKQLGKWSELNFLIVPPAAPVPVSPTANAELSAESAPELHFQWKASDGATHYLIEIKKGKQTIQTQKTTSKEFLIKTLPKGDYSWTVRALIEWHDAKDTKAAQKSQSTPSTPLAFRIIDSSSRKIASQLPQSLEETFPLPGSTETWIELSTSIGPYQYRVRSTDNSNGDSSSGATTGIRFAYGHALSKDVSLQWEVKDTFYRLNALSYDQKGFESRVRYQTRLAEDWRLLLSPGLTLRDNFSIDRSQLTMTESVIKFFTLGPQLRAEIQHPISQTFLLGAVVDFYYPISTFAPPQKAKQASKQVQWSIGATSTYRLNQQWGLYSEVTYQKRDHSFQLNGAPKITSSELSSFNFQLGFHYLFGQPL